MSPAHPSWRRQGERGQLFTAWIVGIFIIAAMILYVTDAMRRERLSTQSIIYRELALNVARAGFEQAESYFHTHPDACYLPATDAPTSQAWVTPWPAYPDAAFEPGSNDTDFYDDITVACSICSGGVCAGGIIGDVPMDQFVTFTTTEDAGSSQLWGRYVVRRQNIQNWSPGPDTATVNTDPDACHDISAIATQSPLGSGARWSIVSRGYILRLPAPITGTALSNSLLASPTAFTDGNLLSAPLSFVNNQAFLMGQARVYGEVSRLAFDLPAAAALVPWSTTATGGTSTLLLSGNALLSGGDQGGGYPFASNEQYLTPTACSGCIFSASGNQQDPEDYSPGLSAVFPGQTWATLETTAASLSGNTSTASSSQIMGYTSAADLPVYEGFNSVTGLSYTSQIAIPSFYYIGSSLTLSSGTDNPVLSGVGICVVDGSLDIEAGNDSSWSGILYASGEITLAGPATVNGIVVSDTGLTMGGGGSYATVLYSADMLTYVQSLLQGFTVDSSSIVATGF